MRPVSSVCALALLAALSGVPRTQTMELVRPGGSGVPGEEIRTIGFAPDGLFWVGARWPFWREGGVGLYHRGTDLWTTYGTRVGGFPSAFPNDLAWATDGSAWIATDGGLVHWANGVSTTYTPANSPLLHPVIRDVAVAPDGHIWVNNTSSITGGALFEFDGGSWRQFTIGAELPWPGVFSGLSGLAVDQRGHVFVAAESHFGVAEFDGVTWQLHGAGVDIFSRMAVDTAGIVWLRVRSGRSNAFYRFDPAAPPATAFTRIPAGATPYSIGVDDDGSVFLGDWNGTVRVTRDGGQSFSTFAQLGIRAVDIAPDPGSDEVWIAGPGAVRRFDAAGSVVAVYSTFNTGIGDYFVDRFDLDRSGNLWVASGESGLSRFDGSRWRNWGEHNGGSEPYPFAGSEPMGGYYEDRNGVGWMGGNGIGRWDPASGTFTGFWNYRNTPALGTTLITHFAEDAQGRLFAASTFGPIYRFDGTTWVLEPVASFSNSGLPGMVADSRGELWVADGDEVHHWNGSQWGKLELPNVNFFFDLRGVQSFAVAPDDTLWFGTGRGLVHWDRQAFWVYNLRNSPLPAPVVTGVDVRADGVLGLATRDTSTVVPYPNGAVIIDGDIRDPSRWQTWSFGSSPLPHYQLGDCAFDGEGNLWVSAISEGAAVLLDPAMPLRRDRSALPASTGGDLGLSLVAGALHAGQSYAVLGSVSGTAPGLPLPGGARLPLNPDPFTQIVATFANTSLFPGFVGTLDAAGAGTAGVALPPLPAATGLTAHFAYTLLGSFAMVSNPVALRLTP